MVIADPLERGGIDLLRQTLTVVEATETGRLEVEIGGAHALVVRSGTRVTNELLGRATHLRLVARAGIGVDNVDVEAATRRGILVINAPLGNVRSTAEHTIALIFALARRVPQADRAVRDGSWKNGYQGMQLAGKRLGVVGLGKVGKQVASMAAAIGLEVIGHDPYLPSSAWDDLPFRSQDLKTLLAVSDLVTLHVPLTPETACLVGERELHSMQRGSYLVNCARGGLVDEIALAHALQEGHLAGAALDVYGEEPLLSGPLLSAPNLILTPHVAASTREAQTQVSADIALQIIDFFAGRPVAFPINATVIEEASCDRVPERCSDPSFDSERKHDRVPNLRVPGPTPVPERVARSGTRAMVNHRGPEFGSCMAEVAELAAPFFGTDQDVLLLTGSGTGALEAALVNVLSPGDEVLSATCGVFGDRFAGIAEVFGASVSRLQAEWGTATSPASLEVALEAAPGIKAVFLTHNETSTGVTNDLPALAGVVRRLAPEALILVDGVSSIGAIPFEMDAWQVDVAVTGSQKAWMSPPGIALLAVSERGWMAHRNAGMPRYYWDLTKARQNAQKHTTPFTPAVGVVHGLREALRMMAEEGLENVFVRHRRVADHVRAGVSGLGLDLFADRAVASDTVTAVRIPPHLSSTLVRSLREEQDVVVGSGQDWLKGQIFRIGHLGWVHERDIDHLLEGLKVALEEEGLEEAG
ncbi:MAG: aminotransferase class V-fold PLP-dependent enzyme [Chloroflexota bacterium]|nr:aminotransferase class V-fold PLP-dependent enzyme [Chloroflexota bacterium]